MLIATVIDRKKRFYTSKKYRKTSKDIGWNAGAR